MNKTDKKDCIERYSNRLIKYGKTTKSLGWSGGKNSQKLRFESICDIGLKENQTLLDIGCGFGLFSHVAQFNGHKVDSIDIPNASPILKEASKLLKIKKHEFTIKKKVPLLKLNKKFDVVTAFQIYFNGHCSKELWDVDDWKYFLLDIHDNILDDDGSIVLVFNMEHKKKIPIKIDGEILPLGSKELEEFFNPFFIAIPGMHRSNNKVSAVLTKNNIKMACQSQVFKKQSYSIDIKASKYGA